MRKSIACTAAQKKNVLAYVRGRGDTLSHAVRMATRRVISRGMAQRDEFAVARKAAAESFWDPPAPLKASITVHMTEMEYLDLVAACAMDGRSISVAINAEIMADYRGSWIGENDESGETNEGAGAHGVDVCPGVGIQDGGKNMEAKK